MFAEGEMFSKEGVSEEITVEKHLEEIVRIVVVKNYSLSESSGVVADTDDRRTPHFDELNHIGSQFPQVMDVLKDYFKLIFPTLSFLLSPLFVFVPSVFFGNFHFLLNLSFLS